MDLCILLSYTSCISCSPARAKYGTENTELIPQ